MNVNGNAAAQTRGRWLNNQAENSRLPFRQREEATVKFRDVKTPQTFSAAHASIYNHFNLESHLNLHNIFKQDRTATLAERRQMIP